MWLDTTNITYLNETGFVDDNDIGVTWAVWKHGERNNSPWKKRTKTYNKKNIVIDLFHDPVRGCRSATGFEFNQKTYIRNSDLKGKYSFLGDIHKFQYLNKEKTIGYPSSLIAQNFGEGDDKFHGYLLWNLDDGSSKAITVKNDYSFNTIIINRFSDFDDLDFDIDNLTKNMRVRIVWQTLPEKRSKENERRVIDYIKEYLSEEILSISHKNEFIEEDEIDHIEEDELDMDNLSLQEVQHEIFTDYLKKIGVEEEFVEKVVELDDEISSKIEVEDFTNIQWSILKLGGKNFMSYEDIDIDWRDLDGLFQITGLNTAGKTTIMKLMTYILYDKTLETETRMKAGDSRYVNNRLPVTFCEGTMVIDVNGEYFGIRRRTDVEKNKAGEVKSAPTTLGYYKLNTPDDIFDDDVNNIDVLGEDNRIQTQKVIEKAIGSYDNFMRVVMTTSDTLNTILSGEKAKFIDALLYDSGLDIFDVKLNAFKEYQKKINALPRVTCNIETTRDKILGLEKDIETLNNQIDSIEKTDVPKINEGVKKGEDFVENLTKKLHNIDDDVYNLDIDHVQEEIVLHQKQIELLKEKEERLDLSISELKETFEEEELNGLREKQQQCVRDINGWRNIIKEEEQKILMEQHKLSVVNGEIIRLKKEGANCKEEIKILQESETCPTCGQEMGEEHLEHVNVKIKEIEHRMFKEIAPAIKEKASSIPKINNAIALIKEVNLSLYNSNIDTLNEDGVKILEEIGVLENDRNEVYKRRELEAELLMIPTGMQNWKLKISILNKNVELYEKSKKQIEENQKIEVGIGKAKTRLNELKFESNQLKDMVYAKNTQRGNNVAIIRDLNDLIILFIDQEKQDDIMSIYKKCIHRDGIPTQLLMHKAIPKINQELGTLLTDVPFSVWLDSYDLKLKLAYNNRIDAVIDAISASGKERTFSAISLKFALNQVNAKSKPTIFLLDEIMGKLSDDSVEEFVMILHAIKDKMKKVLVVEHNHEIEPDYVLEVTKDENDVSQLKLI